jgi:cellulose synthase/poly-beta-1,6-N-acetylglucosamine synthase-like glycosyltransferase
MTLAGVMLAALGALCLAAALYYLAHMAIVLITGGGGAPVGSRSLRPPVPPDDLPRFLILIPARDEAGGLGVTLASVRRLTYPPNLIRVVVVADRCRDATVAVARAAGADVLERMSGPAGKGAALAWALARLRSNDWDALVVLDADAVIDRGFLRALARRLAAGQRAIQADKRYVNPDDSGLTALSALTNALRNRLFYGAKETMGLSAPIQGLGFCVARSLVERIQWDTGTVAEDLDYSMQLALAGVRVRFAAETWVASRETTTLRRATAQRLRWSGGRFDVAQRYAARLLMQAVRRRDRDALDAAVALALPNYSLLANLTLTGLAASAFLWRYPPGRTAFGLFALAALLQALYLIGGALATGNGPRTLAALALAPGFLVWKAGIDLVAVVRRSRVGWSRSHREWRGGRR